MGFQQTMKGKYKAMKTKFCVALAVAALVPFGARCGALTECARLFEADMRDGVIHGAAVVAQRVAGTTVIFR